MRGHKNRSQEIRNSILRKTEESIFRYGIRQFTMNDLASELGISKKTIYRHFRDKKELVEEVVDGAISRTFAEQDMLLARATTQTEKIFAVFYPVFKLISKMDKVFFKDLSSCYPEILQKIDVRRNERLKSISEKWLNAPNSPILRRIPPGVIMNLITVSATNFMNPENLIRLGITPAEALMALFSTFALGLANEEDRKELVKKLENEKLPPIEGGDGDFENALQ